MLICKPLTSGSKIHPYPGEVTSILVVDCAYPTPGLSITTLVITPFSTTALNLAPIAVPTPTTSKSGAA